MKNKNYLIGLFSLLMITVSCSHNQSYEDVVKEELSKGVRYDSLFYNIHLGITYDDFTFYCFKNHLDGAFKPNAKGTAVALELTEGFSAPVQLEFFPKNAQQYEPIKKFTGLVKYKDFSRYDKKYAIENLVKETLQFFEKGYGGREFITIPHENRLLKYNYIKIDGNRKILLKPTFNGDLLLLEIEDLNPIRKDEN